LFIHIVEICFYYCELKDSSTAYWWQDLEEEFSLAYCPFLKEKYIF
jgi:hypothetical protein